MFLRVAPMMMYSLPFRFAASSVLAAVAGLTVGPGAALADYITLRNGGEIRGELLSDSSRAEARSRSRGDRLAETGRDGVVSIRTLSGALVAVGTDEVDSVVGRSMNLEKYETLRRASP